MKKNWLHRPISDMFAPATASTNADPFEVGNLKTVRQTTGQTVDKNNPLSRDDRSLYKTDVKDYRYARNADELLMLLSKYDPDVSAGVWNFLRLADSGLKLVALDQKRQPNQKMQGVLDSVLFRLSGMTNYRDWDLYRPIELVASTVVKYTLLRGGCGLELVLDNARRASKFVVVDPVKVQFKHPAKGQFVPFQKKRDGSEVMLNIPTFFWQLLDPDADTPYENPPFLPVLQAVLFNISVMQDLERIVKRVAYPRISIKIIEETLRKFAPIDAQTDETEMTAWLKSQKNQIGEALSTLKPEDAAVFFDSLDVNILETKSNATIDFRPLKEIIDQRIIAGLKSLPTILGRQFGSSQTIGGVESLLYAKSIASLQAVAKHLLSRSLTLALRLEGQRGYVRVDYKPVSLRPENELEAFRGLEQARILEQLSLGLITDEQAAEVLTGSSYLPPGYQRLSGTGFYEGRDLSALTGSLATRNPTAEEGAGSGRNRE